MCFLLSIKAVREKKCQSGLFIHAWSKARCWIFLQMRCYGDKYLSESTLHSNNDVTWSGARRYERLPVILTVLYYQIQTIQKAIIKWSRSYQTKYNFNSRLRKTKKVFVLTVLHKNNNVLFSGQVQDTSSETLERFLFCFCFLFSLLSFPRNFVELEVPLPKVNQGTFSLTHLVHWSSYIEYWGPSFMRENHKQQLFSSLTVWCWMAASVFRSAADLSVCPRCNHRIPN